MLFQGLNYVCLQISSSVTTILPFVVGETKMNVPARNCVWMCVCYLFILHFSLFKLLITAVA